MSFKNLGLSASLETAVQTQGYENAYPIQEKAIPAIITGKDLLGIAQTGSGKTASYVLPILHRLQHLSEEENRALHTLVLVPTRELAEQVRAVFQDYIVNIPERIKSVAVYGGVAINPQMQALRNVNVLIATPGRLLELQASNAVSFKTLQTLVLDEADKMLNLGFQEEMDRIFALLPKKRQNLLFSATLSEDVERINRLILRNPEVIKIEAKKDTIELIKQSGYFVSEERKGPLLRYIIKNNDLQQVLVFTSSSYKADNVADKLRKNGIDAAAMHGKKSMKARKDALRKFRNGGLRVLVATDLLSRGIDIEFLPHVINYELPRSPKDYIHRIGRTGRAESPGDAISLITPEELHHFKVIQKKMKTYVEMEKSDDLELGGF